MQKSLSLILTLSCFILSNFSFSGAVKAQEITTDGTTNTSVESDGGGNFTIEQGDRAGNNLFHSFGDFSVPTNGSALFNNGTDISNIFSRVTGGNISNIDGLIQANGSANLFLVNPAGILFGNNARLDIGGSFLGTTADSILFEDGLFSATDLDNPPLLTVNAPIGLNFRDNPGNIVNNSIVNDNNGLEVDTGQNITLLGGNVTFGAGNIFAPGGRVEIGGLISEGTIRFDENGNLDFSEDVTKGNVSLTQGAEINVTSGNSGFIMVNADNLEILNGSAIIAGIGDGLGSSESQAGDVVLNVSDKLTLQGDANTLSSRIANFVNINGSGDAGNIFINTNILEGTGNFAIGSATAGQGNAGKVIITANENITFDGLEGFGSGIASAVAPTAIGNGNDIIINTSSLSLANTTQLATSTTGQGDAGNIQVNATDSIALSDDSVFQAASFGQGNGGSIELSTTNLTLTQGGQVIASTFGEGDAGAVTINASGTISADGENSNGFSSGVFSTVEELAVGNSGGINITTTDLTLTQGGVVNASTFGEGDAGAVTINASSTISADGENSNNFSSGVFSTVGDTAVGNSGGINITTTDLTLTQGGQVIASTFGEGDAGAVTINASSTISADGENSNGFSSGVFSTVDDDTAVGNSGGINITTTDLTLTQGGVVNASTFGEGDSGAVTINASSTISADGENSNGFSSGVFSAVAETGKGNAAGINITTTDLTLTQGGVVDASTFGEGDAGAVTINASSTISADGENSNGFSSGVFSAVAETGKGNAAGINITTTDLTLTQGGVVDASTFGEGDAGAVTINASSTISADGENSNGFSSGVLSAVTETGKGNAAGININSNNLSLSQNATISVSSNGEGNASNLSINTNSLALDNGASLTASTPVGTGGNINLQIAKNLTLQENSTISAQAFSSANGGNLTIDTNFIIGFPNETPGDGSDIIASAEVGNGGNITITAESLLGIEPGTATPGNETNDIDADSESGLDGTISIFTPDTSVVQGVTELPNNVVEPDQTVAQACSNNRGVRTASSFVINGKGGVPPLPNAPMNSETITINAATEANAPQGYTIATGIGDITPARGVMETANGTIVLTANPVSGNASRVSNSSPHCR